MIEQSPTLRASLAIAMEDAARQDAILRQGSAVYLTDPADFCRACKGEGQFTDPPRFYGEAPLSPVTCTLCGGSGFRCVVILEA